LVRFEGVRKSFRPPGFSILGSRHYVKAVSDVSLSIREGDTLGLVGESGSGKTTLGRLAVRLLEPTSGKILFKGNDIAGLKGRELRLWRKNAQMVFQDPIASLPPHMTIGKAIERPLEIHLGISKAERRGLVDETLERVGLAPASHFYGRHPHELSGGQAQRAAIARALILKPQLVVADEPVAMLDVSLRAQIIEMLRNLKEAFRLTYLLITHDLSVAGYLCNRIAVMYLGKIIEIGMTDEIFNSPQHPYTAALLSAVPVPDPNRRRSSPMTPGEIANPLRPPPGCHYHPRCKFAVSQCRTLEPIDVYYSDSHYAKCPVRPFVNSSS
jgi:peptide/nickel transport system ATP-binding protein